MPTWPIAYPIHLPVHIPPQVGLTCLIARLSPVATEPLLSWHPGLGGTSSFLGTPFSQSAWLLLRCCMVLQRIPILSSKDTFPKPIQPLQSCTVPLPTTVALGYHGGYRGRLWVFLDHSHQTVMGKQT